MYDNIFKNIAHDDKRIVIQLLMGRGKTSVIVPLLSINTTDKPVIIVTREHLVLQTFNELIKYCGINTKNVDRQFMIINETDNIDKMDIGDGVYVMSDTMLKQLFLKNKLNKTTNEKLFGVKQPLMIFDEFDTLYCPSTSDYNIGNDGTKLEHII